MRTVCLAGILVGFLGVSAAAAPAPEEKDYQKIADKEAWEWMKEKASVFHSQKQYKGDFDLELQAAPKEGKRDEVMIRFLENKKEVFSIQGHGQTVFAEQKSIVFYADYSQFSSGCAVVAYDLKNKKQLWKSNLKGLGPIAHTRYQNAVILELKDDALHILGNESAGKYVEYLELKSGKTVGHRIFKEE